MANRSAGRVLPGAQDEANHGAAAREEDDEAENVPEDDDMDAQ